MILIYKTMFYTNNLYWQLLPELSLGQVLLIYKTMFYKSVVLAAIYCLRWLVEFDCNKQDNPNNFNLQNNVLQISCFGSYCLFFCFDDGM